MDHREFPPSTVSLSGPPWRTAPATPVDTTYWSSGKSELSFYWWWRQCGICVENDVAKLDRLFKTHFCSCRYHSHVPHRAFLHSACSLDHHKEMTTSRLALAIFWKLKAATNIFQLYLLHIQEIDIYKSALPGAHSRVCRSEREVLLWLQTPKVGTELKAAAAAEAVYTLWRFLKHMGWNYFYENLLYQKPW